MAVQENTPLGSYSEMRLAAQAAVRYVNQELGGIQGRPIRLATCATTATPESNLSCAHQIVDQSPVAILGGADFQGASAIPVYAQAQLPILGGVGYTAPELSYPRSIRFEGFPVAGPPALAALAVDQIGAKRVALVYPDTAAARSTIEHYFKPVLRKKGIPDTNIDSGVASPGTVDWAPVVGAAVARHPDAIIALTNPTNCLAILQARATLASSTPLLTQSICSDPRLMAQAGTSAEGVYFVYQFVPPVTATDPDVKTFLAKLKQYGPANVPVDDLSQAGFSEVMDIWDVLHAAGPSALTQAGILTPFKDGRTHHNFMAHSYRCDGVVVPAFPPVCDGHARWARVQNGKIVDSGQWIDGSSLIS